MGLNFSPDRIHKVKINELSSELKLSGFETVDVHRFNNEELYRVTVKRTAPYGNYEKERRELP